MGLLSGPPEATSMNPQKLPWIVTPAKAGVQKCPGGLDSRLRGNDREALFCTFYEALKILSITKNIDSL